MTGCFGLIRNIVFTWIMTRLGVTRALGCGCLLVLAAGLCVFFLISGAAQTLF